MLDVRFIDISRQVTFKMKTMSVSFRPIDRDGHPKVEEEAAAISASGAVLDKMSMSGKPFQQHASDDRSELRGDLMRKRAPSPPPIPGSEPQPEPDAEPNSQPDVVPAVNPGPDPDTSPDVFPPEPAPV